MSVGFEVRYLSIEWRAEGAARKIEVAPAPLVMERADGGMLKVEASIFNDFHPWLGIRLDAGLADVVPLVLTASGQQNPLLRVEDPADGSAWWVQNDGWDEATNRHLSELMRSAGAYRFRIGEQLLLVENRISSFGRVDIQGYVDDFRDELLWMIMNHDSTATAKGGGPRIGQELLECLRTVHDAVGRILAAPAVAVKEIQEKTVIAKLRPSSSSFREYARNPSARQLTGRVPYESIDTAENGYIRYILAAAIRLTKAYVSSALRYGAYLETVAEQQEMRAHSLQETKVRKVDPEVFDRQASDIRLKLDRIAEYSDQNKGGQRNKPYPIRLGRDYHRPNCFFYERLEADSGVSGEPVQFRVVTLPSSVYRLVKAVISSCKEFTFVGVASSSTETANNGKLFLHLELEHVVAITPHTEIVERMAAKRARLEAMGWIVPIRANERRELDRESRISAARAARARSAKRDIQSRANDIREVLIRLEEIDAELALRGAGMRATFPMGMVLVSNPNYSACVAGFNRLKKLLSEGGVDEATLDQLDSIGVLHASDVYEKWCLVQICQILMFDFGFQPEPGWRQKLVLACVNDECGQTLSLSRDDLGLTAVLAFQEELPNGRRPDFVLRISTRTPDAGRNGKLLDGIVIDAKFRSDWGVGEPRKELDELVLAKGYGRAIPAGRVWIVQPCSGTVRPPASPLDWGRHCDYGSTGKAHLTGWVQAGIRTSGEKSIEHLKRLLIMVFQHAIPEPVWVEDDSGRGAWESTSFCIGCGESHQSDAVSSEVTSGGGTRWRMNCRKCGVWTVRTRCFDCKRTLFKNGTIWTYHETLADEVTNVMCPDCGSYFESGRLA